MKSLVIIYSEDDWNKKTVLENNPHTRQTIENLCKYSIKHGITLYRANIEWYNSDKNIFKKAWGFKNKQWAKINSFIKPDFILDKLSGKQDYKMFDNKITLSKKTVMLNNPLFRTMLGNKLSQYLCLGEFMPKSFLAMQENELPSILKKAKTKKIVAKPIYGSGGFGITIEEKNKIKNNSLNFPVIIQEFIEGKGGIPRFSAKNELADLRIVFINHKPIYALSRIAQKDSLFTNFHQGAKVVLVPQKSIPQSVKNLVKKIICKLSIYPKSNYSLDFMFDRNGNPYLIEMNTSPGLDLLDIIGTKKIKDRYFSEIIKSLND
ncbi:MAG TPA: hypothetical protein DCS28_03430 [Candidatus Moranbacteria bacterium]|nr:hypothetical protein [Candidatus Moranbacteria bacterium]HAT75063.1 hypothetical protein [Candidatus Moranbacteria bacterium]